jgi:hypothetical protein
VQSSRSGDVGADPDGLAARAGDLCSGGLGSLCIDVGEDHGGALARGACRAGKAHAPGGAGHQHHLTGEAVRHESLGVCRDVELGHVGFLSEAGP